MAFGKHIIGSYGLDRDFELVPMLTYTASPSDKAHGYPAAFMPIDTPLSIADQGSDILYFFCLFYSDRSELNLHIYAKSMVYAYKQLIEHTNILDAGQVRFFIDSRCAHSVMPYLQAANIHSLAVLFSSDKPVNYASYIPCFYHEAAQPFRYRFYTDLDMWWANMSDHPPFDFNNLIEKWDAQPESIYGQRVPKTVEQTHVDFYERYLKDETLLAELRQIMRDKFGAESFPTEEGISGTRNAVRAGKEALMLQKTYEQYGNLLRDDECFWTFFLKDTGYDVSDIGLHIPGSGPRKEEMEQWQHGPIMVNVGTYAFDHYHPDRYQGFAKLYEHFKA